jgi:hypothetical protein
LAILRLVKAARALEIHPIRRSQILAACPAGPCVEIAIDDFPTLRDAWSVGRQRSAVRFPWAALLAVLLGYVLALQGAVAGHAQSMDAGDPLHVLCGAAEPGHAPGAPPHDIGHCLCCTAVGHQKPLDGVAILPKLVFGFPAREQVRTAPPDQVRKNVRPWTLPPLGSRAPPIPLSA